MAASSPLLMSAILAIAALHYSRTNGHNDLYDAMALHDRCLSIIVPMLNNADRVNDDCVLITTTILHLYDGLECELLQTSTSILVINSPCQLALTCPDTSKEPRSSSPKKLSAILLDSAEQSSGFTYGKKSTTPAYINAASSPTSATVISNPIADL